jgi:tyrosinase
MAEQALRVRRSITDLQRDYDKGNKKPLEDLFRAWKGIKDLKATDPNSFFMIGGYHGEPFRGAGWGNSSYWGGYCNHGNVLFPTWHRAYLLRLEDALRSIPGCQDVTLPYWDETSEDSLANGIPWALTVKDVVLDGQTIANPLRSFVFNANIVDHIASDNPNYSKPLGYETVRYPLSGLVGPNDIERTRAHNARFPNYDENVKILNKNIVDWLTSYIVVNGQKIETNVHKKYLDCLQAPNYTVFSNTSSAAQWNDNLPPGSKPVVPLESPHNSIHLAVGGCDVPGYNRSPIPFANGDMGENDTAGLDPIFFFHHCFVDRVFWLWQKRHGFTDRLEVMAGYPGTNSVDSQGPTPGTAPNAWLSLASPLDPFVRREDGRDRPYTSLDVINIERQCGYTYGPGSLETQLLLTAEAADADSRIVAVEGVNRGRIRGSFLISAFATVDGEKRHLGTEAVLSRWHVEGCANCQNHLQARAYIGVAGPLGKALDSSSISVEVFTRDQPAGAALAAAATRPAFRFHVR